jgi:hypothetical protein
MTRKSPRAAKPPAKATRPVKGQLTAAKRRQLATALHRSAPTHPPEISRPGAQPAAAEQALLAARLYRLAPDAPPARPRATPSRGG